MNRPRNAAFTLVELSIVLVILGLLVGGVLAGQSLIRSAELRAIGKEEQQFEVALNAFRDKYFSSPGDLANAFAFWGATCGTNATTIATGCNGDGDGKIEWGEGMGENVRAWEHLALAGLIEGNYDGSGTVVSLGTDAIELSATNSPQSKFSNGIWYIASLPGGDMDTTVTIADGLYLTFGSFHTSPLTIPGRNRSLTLGEAWILDTKMDDGHASTGKIRGDQSMACADDNTDYYGIIANGGADLAGLCRLHFILKR